MFTWHWIGALRMFLPQAEEMRKVADENAHESERLRAVSSDALAGRQASDEAMKAAEAERLRLESKMVSLEEDRESYKLLSGKLISKQRRCVSGAGLCFSASVWTNCLM